MRYEFEPVGHIESPYREKSGIPRQSRLAPSAHARLRHDPRPAFQRHTDGAYAARLLDLDAQWVVGQERFRMTGIRNLRPSGD
jgi:tRNA (L-threonylcarbamoyladenosine(37)-C2) methyltransferase TrmO-like protein